MNQKNLKKLRKFVRSAFANEPVRHLVGGHTPNYMLVPDFAAGLNPNGTPKLIPVQITGTLRNAEASQRGRYRAMKTFWKQAQHAPAA